MICDTCKLRDCCDEDEQMRNICLMNNHCKYLAEVCFGCRYIGLRYPYPAMYPCNDCRRVHSKDYFQMEDTNG